MKEWVDAFRELWNEERRAHPVLSRAMIYGIPTAGLLYAVLSVLANQSH